MADHLIDGLTEFGEHSMQRLEELNKALGTGQDGEAYGNGAYNDMSALRPQSLEGTLKIVTAGEQHIKFWKSIGKKQAFNTVEEFNVLDSYGGNSSPFFVEGGLPNEEDSNYIRQSQMVKFLGTTRVITHPATLVQNTVGDIVARETTNGTLWLLQQLERALYFADSSIDPLAFDGVIAQVRNFVSGKPYESQHIIDMRGEPLDENTLEDMATIIADNYGSAKLDLHLTNQVHKDFSKLVTGNGGRQRVMMSGNPGEIRLGQPIRGYSANVADIDFVNNIFLKPEGAPKSVSQKGAPATPTLDATTPIEAAADATSKMDAGTYYYFVSAKNSAGESAPVATGSVAVTAGQKVTIKINRVVSDPAAKSYRVYRGTSSDPAKALFAFEVKDAGSGTTQDIVDRNFDIPGTDTAVLIDNDPENVLTFKQLAPLMKLPLARISASERFMILLYGMVQVYNPRRIVVVKNIGKLGLNSNRELFNPSYGAESFGTVKPVAR
jgi:hypothetical protein